MKKIKIFLFATAMVVLNSCEKEQFDSNAIQETQTNTNAYKKIVPADEIITGPPLSGGFTGWLGGFGVYVDPSTYSGPILNTGCHAPGECLYAESFGGGSNRDLWKGRVLDTHTLRLDYLNPRDYTPDYLKTKLVEGLGSGEWSIISCCGDDYIEDVLANTDVVAENMYAHYNIPRFLPFATEINNKFVQKLSLPSGTQLYTVPSNYEVIVNSEHPNGYIDLKLYIQQPGQSEPATPPANNNPDCAYVWNGTGYQLLCK